MDVRGIKTVTWGLPPEWVAWDHGNPEGARGEVLALGDDDHTVAAVMAAVHKFEAIGQSEISGTVAAALWVPGPARREPLAAAALRLVGALPEGRWDLERLLEEARSRVDLPFGTRLLDVAAVPSRVVAGEAVLRIVDTSPRFRRRVSREWVWFILPEGTDLTVMCHVESSAVQHFDEIAEMTTAIANSVAVTLADE